MTTEVQEQEQVAEPQAAPVAPPETPAEKLAKAQAMVDALNQEIQTAVANGEDFTAKAIAYADAIGKYKALNKTANQGAIDEETSQIGLGIATMVGASKLEDLMSEPVTSVFWQVKPGEGENGPVVSCGINVRARATSTKSAGKTTTSGGSGRVPKETFQVDNGPLMTPKEFIDAHATDETRAKSLFSTGKWPTKPEFLNEAADALTAAGSQVVRAAIVE